MATLAFTMEDLKKRIQEQTVVSMGMMIPDEHLKQLIDEAIDAFFKTDQKWTIQLGSSGSWYSRATPTTGSSFTASPFRLMVWEKVSGIVSAIIDEYFNTEKDKVKSEMGEVVLTNEFKTKALANIVSVTPYIAQLQSMDALNNGLLMLKQEIVQKLAQRGVYIEV